MAGGEAKGVILHGSTLKWQRRLIKSLDFWWRHFVLRMWKRQTNTFDFKMQERPMKQDNNGKIRGPASTQKGHHLYRWVAVRRSPLWNMAIGPCTSQVSDKLVRLSVLGLNVDFAPVWTTNVIHKTLSLGFWIQLLSDPNRVAQNSCDIRIQDFCGRALPSTFPKVMVQRLIHRRTPTVDASLAERKVELASI